MEISYMQCYRQSICQDFISMFCLRLKPETRQCRYYVINKEKGLLCGKCHGICVLLEGHQSFEQPMKYSVRSHTGSGWHVARRRATHC